MNRPETTRWRDVTRTLAPGIPVWPGDPQVREEPVARIAEGSPANVTLFSLSSHSGTHVDAPRHFLDEGPGVDRMDVDVLTGPCRVIDLSGHAGHVADTDLPALDVPRILFRTANSSRPWDAFREDYAALLPSAAKALAASGVSLVGVDGPSVELYEQDGFPVHDALLGAGVVLVENLDLAGVEAGLYDLVVAPLKWRGADGAPARVLLRPL